MPYNNQQILMTLAALAGTATNKHMFETVDQQEQRALKWINQILAEPGLATGGAWKAIWVGMSADRRGGVWPALAAGRRGRRSPAGSPPWRRCIPPPRRRRPRQRA